MRGGESERKRGGEEEFLALCVALRLSERLAGGRAKAGAEAACTGNAETRAAQRALFAERTRHALLPRCIGVPPDRKRMAVRVSRQPPPQPISSLSVRSSKHMHSSLLVAQSTGGE